MNSYDAGYAYAKELERVSARRRTDLDRLDATGVPVPIGRAEGTVAVNPYGYICELTINRRNVELMSEAAFAVHLMRAITEAHRAARQARRTIQSRKDS